MRERFQGRPSRLVLECFPGRMAPWEFQGGVDWSDPEEGPAQLRVALEQFWLEEDIDFRSDPTAAAKGLSDQALKDFGLSMTSLRRMKAFKDGADRTQFLFRVAKSLWPAVRWRRNDFRDIERLTELGYELQRIVEHGLDIGGAPGAYETEPPTPVDGRRRRADLRFHDELLADEAGAPLVDVKLGQWTMSRETQRVAEVHTMSIVFGVPGPAGTTITGRFARRLSARDFLQSVWRRRGLASDEPRCTAVLGRLETLAAETIRLAKGERT